MTAVQDSGSSQPLQPLHSRSNLVHLPRRTLEALLIGAVRVYQWTLRPFLGGRCRFEPCCSEYFIAAVRKYGPVRGSLKGIWRICRCQPFCTGGIDPP
jgi:putative membrane protein insertion efficiency factor